MVSYCILNGVKSTSINGLMIQSLPAISKPLIRTEIDEIDGRDGDIVTPLGYSAYNKEMTIGLYGNYDIDDVIQFFDSKGTVTFSNEPDKYYNYEIIEQIDFERLIRFRTATVTFHVQPFKYSAVSDKLVFINDQLSIPDYNTSKNGITLTVHDGEITVSGTASVATEFYIPATASLGAGNYTLKATTTGTNASLCSIRLIKSAPTNEDSLGNTYLGLKDNASAYLSGQVAQSSEFNYLWLYVASGNAVNFTLDVAVLAGQLKVFNAGNTKAKPTMTVYGDGTVNLSLNGNQIFVISITNGYITIDVAQMQAYQGETFLNRYVNGDYDNLMFNIGSNILSWTGNVSQIVLERYSRWI